MSYEHRNRTQLLIMKQIVFFHELVFIKGQNRFFGDWFRLKSYLYKKYRIGNFYEPVTNEHSFRKEGSDFGIRIQKPKL